MSNDSTAVTDLWEQVEPDVLRLMVTAFANAGAGVKVTALPPQDRPTDLEEEDHV